ncbi:MAG: hypothetical protein M1823_005850 [Watsoniomyces obsoletus]|nr:MAG: hypothetical protein M1823_005850 [Watsoniomyces obsoletus]
MYTIEKLSLALVASLATGAQAGLSWQHRRHHHHHMMPRDVAPFNTTAAGPTGTAPYGTAPVGTAPLGTGPMTTSTVYATSLVTVTSCAPTVTECPAGSTVVSTIVIPISTTVCPVSAVNPVVTPPPGAGMNPQVSTALTTEEIDNTLTYTLGRGSSTTVVTTTVKVKTTRTKTTFVEATPEAGSGSGTGSKPEVKNVVNPNGESGDSTTNIPTTVESTSTQFLTVSAVPVGAPETKQTSSPDAGTGSGSGGPGGEQGTCPPASTVTVTAKETVTVTASEGAPQPTAPYGNGTDTNPTSNVASTGFATLPTGGVYPTGSGKGVVYRH